MGVIISILALLWMALARTPDMNLSQSFDLFLDKFVIVNSIGNWILLAGLVLGIVIFVVFSKWLGWDFALPAALTGTCGLIVLAGWIVGRVMITIAASQVAANWTGSGPSDLTGFIIWMILLVAPMFIAA